MVKLAQNWPILKPKIPHFLGKLQEFSPLRARNFEKVHCIFHGNSLHCKGPILEGKFWAERMVVLRLSAPPGRLGQFWDHDFQKAFSDGTPHHINLFSLILCILVDQVGQSGQTLFLFFRLFKNLLIPFSCFPLVLDF